MVEELISFPVPLKVRNWLLKTAASQQRSVDAILLEIIEGSMSDPKWSVKVTLALPPPPEGVQFQKGVVEPSRPRFVRRPKKASAPTPAEPRRRGRPKGSKNKPRAGSAAPVVQTGKPTKKAAKPAKAIPKASTAKRV